MPQMKREYRLQDEVEILPQFQENEPLFAEPLRVEGVRTDRDTGQVFLKLRPLANPRWGTYEIQDTYVELVKPSPRSLN